MAPASSTPDEHMLITFLISRGFSITPYSQGLWHVRLFSYAVIGNSIDTLADRSQLAAWYTLLSGEGLTERARGSE